MLDEIKNIKSGERELREFGVTIGAILIILADVALFREKRTFVPFLSLGILFLSLGLVRPQVLKILQKIWMGLAIIIGFFVSHIILVALFYACITPIGLIMKLLGKDLLDERIEKERASYWIERRDVRTKESYLNQY